uniref:hypothetical protein n=1 Tax=Bacteroides cellulosilyticus TaxID=246787 RepID=UPI004027B577
MKKNYMLCLLLLICMAAFSQTKSNNDGYVSPFEIIEKDLQLGATESEFYVGYGKKLNFGHNGDNMDDIQNKWKDGNWNFRSNDFIRHKWYNKG